MSYKLSICKLQVIRNNKNYIYYPAHESTILKYCKIKSSKIYASMVRTLLLLKGFEVDKIIETSEKGTNRGGYHSFNMLIGGRGINKIEGAKDRILSQKVLDDIQIEILTTMLRINSYHNIANQLLKCNDFYNPNLQQLMLIVDNL